MDKLSLKNSILFFAKKYDKEDVYINLFKTVPFPELVKMVIMLMFDNKFDIYSSSDEEFHHYKIIFSYRQELNRNGYINFQK